MPRSGYLLTEKMPGVLFAPSGATLSKVISEIRENILSQCQSYRSFANTKVAPGLKLAMVSHRPESHVWTEKLCAFPVLHLRKKLFFVNSRTNLYII
jgi:hypothetical protein